MKTTPYALVLIHEQLQDPRIWGDLEQAVGDDVTVHTTPVPSLSTLGTAAWADHIAQHTRAVVASGAVDLAVSVGGAAVAALDLLEEGYVRYALMFNPDPGIAIHETQALEQELHEPETADSLATFFLALEPFLEEFASGRPSSEAIDALLDAALHNADDLPGHHRALIKQIGGDQLRQSLPLRFDTPSERRDGPDWVTRLAPLAGRCTIALSSYGSISTRLRSFLATQAPGVDLVELRSRSWYAWLDDPAEAGTLIRQIIQR